MLKSKLLSHNIYMFYLRYVFSRYYNCQSQGCVDVLGLQQHNISTIWAARPRVCSVEAALPRGGWRPPGPFLWCLMGNIRAGS